MGKKWFKRVFGMLGGAMVGVTSFGANLQVAATSAKPLSGVADDAALEAGKYSISTPEELAKLAKLVNNGHATATGLSFLLTQNLDLTEGGEYTNGYCDRPIRGENGEITGWCAAELDTDGNFQNWKKTGNGGGVTPL